jgi:hypothetical protein
VAGHGQKASAEVGETLGRSGTGQGGSRVGRTQKGHRCLPVPSSEGSRGDALRKEGG